MLSHVDAIVSSIRSFTPWIGGNIQIVTGYTMSEEPFLCIRYRGYRIATYFHMDGCLQVSLSGFVNPVMIIYMNAILRAFGLDASVLSLGNCPVYLRRGDTIELMRRNDIYYFIVPIPSRPTTR